jgi:5'-nucleotidase
MRILLCNDDGIHAPGIIALFDALAGFTPACGTALGEIMVVAPLTVQSATGHGVTFRQPLIVKDVHVNDRMGGVAVDGRPADCVKLALATLWPARFGPGSRPDLCISGMNMGANVGINVLYSGTCAAALEAAFLGVPSIAVSLHHGAGEPRYDVAARHARGVIDRIMSSGGPGPRSCMNLNVPITERDGPAPALSVCPMNTHGMIDSFDKRSNPLGETYYWSSGSPMDFHEMEPGSDVDALFEKRMTLTALSYDLTDRAANARWARELGV